MAKKKKNRKKHVITDTYGRAYCLKCDWSDLSTAPLGHGAKHHDDTGHVVRVKVNTKMEVMYGQTTPYKKKASKA